MSNNILYTLEAIKWNNITLDELIIYLYIINYQNILQQELYKYNEYEHTSLYNIHINKIKQLAIIDKYYKFNPLVYNLINNNLSMNTFFNMLKKYN
tara:strand:- start:231 stop:518 length:288 start_codon:yes stop_codon:yes gene_type:complete